MEMQTRRGARTMAAAGLCALVLLCGACKQAEPATVSPEALPTATALVGAETAGTAETTAVEWADKQFEACVRSMLDIPEGDIFATDLANVTSLYFFGNAACRTRDAEYAYDPVADTVTQGSRVYACAEMSLADVANFPNLDTLALYGGRITGGFDALGGITHLTISHALFLNLFDVALPQLTELKLIRCGVTDVSPLAACTALTALDLTGNRVTNLASLKALPLTEINLTDCGVTDFTQVSDAAHITCGAVVLQTATLDYGETLALSGAPFAEYNFGKRSVSWRTTDAGVATVAADGTVTAGSVQYDPELGYYSVNIIGRPENSDAQLLCTVTVGNGSVFTSKISGRARLTKACTTNPKRFSAMVKDCKGFSVVSRQTAVKGQPFSVPWQVWVRENGRKWVQVHSFTAIEGQYQFIDVAFDAPMSFNMVAVTASDTSASVGTVNGGFSVYALRRALSD